MRRPCGSAAFLLTAGLMGAGALIGKFGSLEVSGLIGGAGPEHAFADHGVRVGSNYKP